MNEFNEDGFNEDGFSKIHLHKVTLTKYNEEGLDYLGRDKNGYSDSERYLYDSRGEHFHDSDDFREYICDLSYHKRSNFIGSYEYQEYLERFGNIFSFDQHGFNEDGFDENGYDKDGFDEEGWHKDEEKNKADYTILIEGRMFNKQGFDIKGFDKDGMYQGISKFNVAGFDINGLDINGFNKYGVKDGYNAHGYNAHGFNRDGFDSEGYNSLGFDTSGYNIFGFHISGVNKYTSTLYDTDGYDINGFNVSGFDKKGCNKDGFYTSGFNKEGIHKDTNTMYNKDGFNVRGRDKNGFNKDGFDKEGYNRDGYDRDGIDKDGYNKSGYDKKGYNKIGFDKDGYHKNGFNKDGVDRDGYSEKYFNTIIKFDLENEFWKDSKKITIKGVKMSHHSSGIIFFTIGTDVFLYGYKKNRAIQESKMILRNLPKIRNWAYYCGIKVSSFEIYNEEYLNKIIKFDLENEFWKDYKKIKIENDNETFLHHSSGLILLMKDNIPHLYGYQHKTMKDYLGEFEMTEGIFAKIKLWAYYCGIITYTLSDDYNPWHRKFKFNKDGYNIYGFNKFGFNKDGYNKYGFTCVNL